MKKKLKYIFMSKIAIFLILIIIATLSSLYFYISFKQQKNDYIFDHFGKGSYIISEVFDKIRMGMPLQYSGDNPDVPDIDRFLYGYTFSRVLRYYAVTSLDDQIIMASTVDSDWLSKQFTTHDSPLESFGDLTTRHLDYTLDCRWKISKIDNHYIFWVYGPVLGPQDQIFFCWVGFDYFEWWSNHFKLLLFVTICFIILIIILLLFHSSLTRQDYINYIYRDLSQKIIDPLGTIMGLTQYLSTIIHSEEEENIIKIILSNEKVISDIILTFDNYLRNIIAKLSSLNIYELVESSIDIFKKDDMFKNISINFIAKDNNIKVRCDEYILKQIIKNILLNYSQTIIRNNYSKSNSINIKILNFGANISLIISSDALIFNKNQLKYKFNYNYSNKNTDNAFNLRLATTLKLAKALRTRVRFLNNQNDNKNYSSVEIILKTI